MGILAQSRGSATSSVRERSLQNLNICGGCGGPASICNDWSERGWIMNGSIL